MSKAQIQSNLNHRKIATCNKLGSGMSWEWLTEGVETAGAAAVAGVLGAAGCV